MRASVEADAPNYIVIISAPLIGVDSTLHRLLLVEILVTAIVLLAMTALGLWVVRVALGPLDAMGKTADAIAAGDLSRRVELTDERTEVGRLGLALNAMLANIEAAVTAGTSRFGRSRPPRASSGASSPTPRTSCGHPWRPYGPTPSSSPAAPPAAPTTSSGR